MSENNRNNVVRAYSLVELLIIMAIFAVIAAMGITALKDFREGAQFRSATMEFEKTIEEIRNLAKNNVVSRSDTVDPTDPTLDPNAIFNVQLAGYYVDIMPRTQNDAPSSPIRLFSCKDGNFISSPPLNADQVRCPTEEQWVLFNKTNFQSMNITVDSATCDGIFFKNASTDLYIIRQDKNITAGNVSKAELRPDYTSNAVKECTIVMQLKNNSNRRVTYTFTEQGNRFLKTNS